MTDENLRSQFQVGELGERASFSQSGAENAIDHFLSGKGAGDPKILKFSR